MGFRKKKHRVGRFVHIPCTLRGKGLGESGGPSLKGKGGLVGFRRSLKVQGSTCSFSKVQETTFIFFEVQESTCRLSKNLS